MKRAFFASVTLALCMAAGVMLSLHDARIAHASQAQPYLCSKSHTGGSVGMGASATFTISCPQAALGDFVQVSAGADSLLLTNSAYVSAAGTVTVLINNVSGGSITSPTTTYYVSGTPAYVSP